MNLESYLVLSKTYLVLFILLTTSFIKAQEINDSINKIEEVVVSRLTFTGNLTEDVKRNRTKLKSYKQQEIIKQADPTNLKKGELVPFAIKIAKTGAAQENSYRNKFTMYTSAQKKYKKAIKEKTEKELLTIICNYFPLEFYTEILQLKEENISNYILYCSYHSDIIKLTKQNEFSKIQIILLELINNY